MVAQLEGGGWRVLDWTPDDQQLIVEEEISINESYLWTVSVSDGKKTLLTPKGGPEKVSYGDAKFRKDGTGIYVVTDRNSELSRLALFDLKTGQYKFLTQQFDWDVTEFDVSPDGRLLAVVNKKAGLT